MAQVDVKKIPQPRYEVTLELSADEYNVLREALLAYIGVPVLRPSVVRVGAAKSIERTLTERV